MSGTRVRPGRGTRRRLRPVHPHRPVRVGEPLRHGPDELAGLREALEQERRFRVEQLAELGTTPAAQDEAPGGALGEVHAIVTAGARRALADIDAALAAMREGRYGRCDACRGPIPWRVLRAVPRTRLCWACRPAEDAAGPVRDPG